MRLVADTSVIVAAIIRSEPRHDECNALLDQATHAFITPHVTAEVFYLLSAVGHNEAALDFLTDVTDGFYELVNPQPDDYRVARDLVARYGGQLVRKRPKPGSLDLADAMNTVVAAKQETTIIATLDQDYRQIEPLNGPKFFTLLPDDIPGS
ncbi:MAG: PIN domain-containing protein [Propionibacteriaceae bacterium]|nr:PIN domain-containing protein [Propionibacteriaceae bacterium]